MVHTSVASRHDWRTREFPHTHLFLAGIHLKYWPTNDRKQIQRWAVSIPIPDQFRSLFTRAAWGSVLQPWSPKGEINDPHFELSGWKYTPSLSLYVVLLTFRLGNASEVRAESTHGHISFQGIPSLRWLTMCVIWSHNLFRSLILDWLFKNQQKNAGCFHAYDRHHNHSFTFLTS